MKNCKVRLKSVVGYTFFPFLFSLCFFSVPNIVYAIAIEKEDTTQEIRFDADEMFFWGEEEKIISATRYIKRLREAPAIATIITAREIKNMGARNLLDVLKIVPGVGIYQEYVGLKTIEVRGVKTQNAEKVLIMINGDKLNDPFYGGAMNLHDDLFLENIKRIEIIRGPGSALYGANAFVAVINVITKNANNIDGLNISVGSGSFNTEKYNIIFGSGEGKLSVSGAFDYIKTEGVKLEVEEDFASFFNSSIAPDDTNAWKEKYDFNLNIAFSDFNIKGRYVDKRMGPYVGAGYSLNDDSVQKMREIYSGLNYNKSLNDNLSLLFKGFVSQFEINKEWEVFSEGFVGEYPFGMRGTPTLKDRTTGAELQLDYLFMKNHSFTAGVLYENIKQFDVITKANFDSTNGTPIADGLGFRDVSDTQPFNQAVSRDIWAIYLQDDWRSSKSLNVTFGTRYDYYSDFNVGTINPRVGIIWSYSDSIVFKLLYGSAFRVPNFQELYNINNPSITGNSDLNPEKISTYETGIEYSIGSLVTGNINYFYNQIRDIIALTSITGGNEYDNISSVDTSGIEFSIKNIWNKDLYSYANYSYLIAKDTVANTDIHDVPTHRGNIGMNIGISRYLNANSNLLLLGSRKRAEKDNREELPAIAILDFSLIGKNFYKTTEIKLSIQNALNQQYADPAPYDFYQDTPKLLNDFPRAGIDIMLEASYMY